mmetsp:Transcript_49557/g.73844  ORF Transcript_49557/g.73844 Transcript_49557/m.73844 type:complete len:97 (-) Transcript_49557:143-433(-)
MMLALIALRMHSQTGERRYVRSAKRAERRLSKLTSCGCPNAACPLLIVRAEFARVVKRKNFTALMVEELFPGSSSDGGKDILVSALYHLGEACFHI